MATAEDIRTTIDSYVSCMSANDRTAWTALFTEDARQEDPVGSPENVGHEAIAGFFDGVVAMLGAPTITLTHEPIIIGQEAVVLLQVVAGTGDSRVRIPLIVDHMRFADDARITQLRAFWDATSLTPDPQ